jgi:nucleoside-diphosphate-sugar epimerase
MEGVWDHDGEQLASAIRRVTGRTELRAKRFAWWLLRLARPVMPLARELLEMRYLWQRELHMRNDRLVAFLGAEPHTPIDQAVRDTLSSMGCLGQDPRNAPVIGSVSRGKPV